MLDITKASAGSGKTFKLARTYIDLLLSLKGSNRHRHILAVTFTKKATAEMKSRIVEELSLLATGQDSAHRDYLMERHHLTTDELQMQAQKLLYDLLQDYSAFAVSTIDSFFQRIIRSFSRELDLPGSYNIELDADHILQEAVDNFFFDLPTDTNDVLVGFLHQLVDERINDNNNTPLKEKVFALSRELGKEVYQGAQKQLEEFFDDRSCFASYQAQLRQKKEELLQQMLMLGKQYMATLDKYGVEEKAFSRGDTTFKCFHWKKQEIAALSSLGITFCKFVEQGADVVLCKKDKDNPTLNNAANDIRGLATKWVALYQQLTELLLLSKELPYLSLLSSISKKISEKNAELSRLPIADTTRLLNDVISANAEAPFVYDKIGVRIAHYLIDEFQDTSRMQWNNFRPLLHESLATDQYNLVVGDVKQSIYRFRNSDYNLMLSELSRNFHANQIDPHNLGDNWRSNCQIVETNNEVFRLLSEAENQEMNALMGNTCSDLKDKIKDVYTDLKQNPQRTKEQGYVRFEFMTATKKEEQHEAVLERLPDLLRDIQSRNIPLGKVAFLLRGNEDIRQVAQYLTQEGFRVMSAEGLLLTASGEIRFLVSLLTTIQSPDDMIQQVSTYYEYLRLMGKDADEAMAAAIQGSNVFSDVQQEALQTIVHLPLFDQVQAIVGLFELDKNDNAKPYIQSLLDCVYRYITKYQADLYSFLQWWKEKADNLSIASSESLNAVQLITAHKSKGLEYDVVIVPFCDWEKGISGQKAPLLWVEPKGNVITPCPLPILPVKYNNKLADTAFAADYYTELQNAYLDNLNLTYVAFTRAKRELYVFAPTSVNDKGKENTNSIGALLHNVLWQEGLLNDDNIYERGAKVSNTTMPTEETCTTNCLLSAPLGNRLRIKLSSHPFLTQEDTTTDLSKPINLGSVMHRILQHIHHLGDEKPLLEQMQQEGNLTPRDVEILTVELQKFYTLVASTDWFSAEYTDLNEQEILLPDSTTRRPDRILLKGKQAIVIDYKFGETLRATYQRQVHDYMSLLSQMGYAPKGYLCYINLQHIEEVSF